MSKKPTDRHHRKCSSRGGHSSPENLATVETDKHRSYHHLFKNWDPIQIAAELNRRWIDPDYVMIAVRKDKKPCEQCDWKGDGLA